ncbi:MAG: hypothetical protein ABI321_15030 [Polyangia bacterium]
MVGAGRAEGEVDIGLGVVTRLVFDGAVSDAELARVTHFEFRAASDEDFTTRVPLPRAAARTERAASRPLALSGAITLEVRALDLSDVEELTSSSMMPLGRWTCLELRVPWADAATGRVRVLLDDVPLDDLSEDGRTTDVPSLTDPITGTHYGDSPGVGWDMWVDEMVIASQSIGCSK